MGQRTGPCPVALLDAVDTESVTRFQAWWARLAMKTAAPGWWFPLTLGTLSGLSLLSAVGAPLLVVTLSVLMARIQGLIRIPVK